MAQEVGKLFRVKKQVQGVVPSIQNSEYYELINLGGISNTIDFKNLSPWYNQYADTNGNFLEYEEPTNWYKKMYGIDTTWELMFNTDSVAFITEGSYSNDGRSNGIQGDAIREISGTFQGGYANDATGAFKVIRQSNDHFSGGTAKFFIDEMKSSYVVPTASVNRMRNRLIRVYHLLSINGVNVSDIIGGN